MARVKLIEPTEAPADVQNIYEHRLRGRPANVHKAMAHLPNSLVPFLAFYASVGKTIEPRLYELIYIRVSMLNHCHY